MTTMQTIGQKQVKAALEAGVTVCAETPEHKKYLIRKKWSVSGYTAVCLPKKDYGLWSGNAPCKTPDMREWDVIDIPEIDSSWTLVRVYTPNIIF